MTHIHLPDGVLPVWLWLLGYLLIILYVLFAFKYKKELIMSKKAALVGIFAALMLIVMSIEILPINYHVNLASLSGMILGPILSVIAIFIVNIMLALFGHGGITVIGLNSLVVSIQAILSFFGLKLLYPKIKNIFIAAFLASFTALFISSWATVGIVYLGTHNINYLTHHHEEEVNDKHHEEQEPIKNTMKFDLNRFILMFLVLGIPGWLLESLIVAFIINYIKKTKPAILEDVLNQ